MEERGFQPALFFIFFVYIGREMSVESLELSPSPKFRFLDRPNNVNFGTMNSTTCTDRGFCVVCVSDPPEMWASSGVLGAISPLPLSSLAASAKSLLQDSGLSDQHRNQHNGEESLGDFAQAAMASTRLIEHKVSAATSAQRARAAQRMARQLWGDTLSSWRHESWQSLMPTVTSAQTVEYASFLSC